MKSQLLTVENLAARRGSALIFDGLTLSLREGESLAFTGKNGAGKSTAIRTMLGLQRPEAGRVVFTFGQEDMPLAAASHYLGHLNAMKRELTAYENLAFWQRFMGDFEGGQGVGTEESAEMVGLGDILDLPYGYLSAGQKRRFALARLLVSYRPVWMLDEPTASLDTSSRALVETLVTGHLAQGGIAIAATHEPLSFTKGREIVFTGPREMAQDLFLPEDA